MNRSRIRRILASVATTALLTLPASAALATPPEHANGGGNGQDRTGEQVAEEDDDTDEVGASLHPSGKDRTDHQHKRQGNSPSDPDGDGRGPDRNDTGTDKPGDDGGSYDGDQDGNNGCGNDQDFEDDNEGWCGRPDHSHGDQGQAPEGPESGSEVEEEQRQEIAGEGAAEGDVVADGETTTSGEDDTGTEEAATAVAGDEEDATGADDEGADERATDEQETDVLADVVVADSVADDTDTPVETFVLGEVAERPRSEVASDGETAVLGAVVDAIDTLPNTGVSAAALALTGLATLGTGARMVRRR